MDAKKIVIIGTGGTIAGNAKSDQELVNYAAGEKKAAELLCGLPVPASLSIETIELCQIDSKDMSFSILRALAACVDAQLQRDDVDGVVITHGTDTLEESAVFLEWTLHFNKPVVLTAAMRPSTAISADGPLNLLDSLQVAAYGNAGLWAVVNNTIYVGHEIVKSHTLKVDGFCADNGGAMGHILNGKVEFYRNVKVDDKMKLNLEALPTQDDDYPWVEIIYSDVSANPRMLTSLLEANVDGLIVVGTGNGTVHKNLLPTLMNASCPVVLTTRVRAGKVVNDQYGLLHAPYGHPAKARIWLILQLLAHGAGCDNSL
ncbi:asparaginase [Wohlfahrtiimonas sp. G9077]|uniref:asparaginase n=1 Tax=Wohlfahrtiimonas sp. G9077 TaxID=1980118 RepID=UPI000B98D67C|nr:asparaginase [Wohlfahrtiimonas sp. G9077]OYQ73131.1 L-asparaginase [Wohlfahrtiimonas sp. G9077]